MTCHIPEGVYRFEEVDFNRERSSGERLKREMGLEHWKRQRQAIETWIKENIKNYIQSLKSTVLLCTAVFLHRWYLR